MSKNLENTANFNKDGKISILDLPEYETYIVLDTETTYNYETKKEELIEFCALEINEDFNILNSLEFLVNPNCPISKRTKEITNIDSSHVQNKPLISERIEEVHSFINNKKIFAHNANFDKKVILNSFFKCNRDLPNCTFIDTLKIARNFFPDTSNSLTNLKKKFGIEHTSHRAKGDVLSTIEIISKFNTEFVKKGDHLFNNLDIYKI